MNTTQLVGWMLFLAKQAAAFTPTTIDDRILEYVNKAYDEYVKVHWTPVTQAQLEDLRTHAKW